MSSLFVCLTSGLKAISRSSFLVLMALCLGLAGNSRAAVTTTIESGGTFSAANYTYHRMTVINQPSSDFMPFRVYRITLPQTSSATGNYTFTLNTTGFGGSLNLYQGSFDPNQPGVNFWENGVVSSSAGTLTYTATSLPAYNSSPSSFEIVVSAANAGATGSFTLSVSGPMAVTVNARQAAADFGFVDNLGDKTIVAGSSTNLYVYCNGPIPQSFQWYRGEIGDQSDPIVGANANQVDVSPSLTTKYWVKIRKADGTTVNSSVATITVTGSTTVPFNGEYVSNDRTLGSGAFYHVIPFKVTTQGFYKFRVSLGAKALYQGSFNPAQPNVNYSGTDDTQLMVGTYILVVSSSTLGVYDGDISGPQPVTLLPLPSLTIVENPDDAAVAPGGSATLRVATEGGGTPSYTWYKGESGDTSAPISGATAISYTTPALTATSKYWVRVTDGTTILNSASATVYVLTPPVVYSDQLINTDPIFNRPQLVGTVLSDSGQNTYYKVFRFKISTTGSYTFTLTATGYQPAWVLYQGAFIPSDATVNLFDLSPLTANPTSKTITLSASPQYYYLAITSKNAGSTGAFSLSVTNGPALIVPDYPPIISAQPADQNLYVDAGQTGSATLSVATTNSTDSYQWYLGTTYSNRVAIAGANSATYTASGLAGGSTNVYSVRLSNSGGYTDSRFATVTALAKPPFLVTTLSDTSTANDGLTSLREAIVGANSVGAGSITFASNLSGTITLASALPALTSQTSINGGSQPITVDGNSKFTCFTVSSGSADIRNITISGGLGPVGAAAVGGGLEVTGGTVNVRGVLFTSNQGNSAPNTGASSASAGGAVNVDGGAVTLSDCTFTSNTGSTFNGKFSGAGALGGSGAAQVNGGSLSVSNCTVTANTGGQGGGTTTKISPGGLGGSGGLTRLGGTLTVANSIVYSNTSGAAGTGAAPGKNPNPDISGTFTAGGTNLTTNPKLSPLANHGGPTLTYSLLISSAAIDAGDASYISSPTDYDQRGPGYLRVQSGRLDIGALEVRPPSVTVSLSSTSPKTNDILTATPHPSDFDATPTYTYQWTIGGRSKQSGSSNTFNLATAGFGDKGQTVACSVSAKYSTQSAISPQVTALVANSAPIATVGNVPYTRDTPVNFSLNGTDADNDTLSYKVTSLPAKGTLKRGSTLITAASLPYAVSGALTFTPNMGTGSDIFNFSASDGTEAGSAAVTLTMTNETAQTGPGFVVNKTADYDDGVCGITDCTLREAISASNSYNAAHGNAGTQITFDAGVFGASRQTITLNGNRLVLSSNMNITAPTVGLTLDGNHLSTVLYVNSGIAILYNLTVTNGFGGTTGGGGLYNTAAVSFHNCTFTANSSGTGNGGAVYNAGLITVNTSTFAGNSAVSGGGIYNPGQLIINGSTFAANSASASGGGIYNVSGSGSIQMNNSIIAANTATTTAPDLEGAVTSGDYNLVQNLTHVTLTGTHNVTGQAAQLLALAENGGPTPTVALAPGSPAINAADPAYNGTGAFDQRGSGFPRIVDGRLDIGAFEATSLPELSIASVSQLEGNSGTPQPMRFTLSLSKAWTTAVTINYATAGGTATAGSDFSAVSGTLTIPAGETTGTIAVPIIGDMVSEADETFALNLSSPSGTTLAGGGSTLAATGTILNDDVAPVITLSGVTLAEGDAGTTTFTFKASLSAPSQQTVTVHYETADGTATAGDDYTAASGTLTFAPGSTSGSVDVGVNGDTAVEPDETFNLTLSSPTVAVFTGGAASISAVGTVLNDDSNLTPPATDVSSQVTVYKSSITRDRVTGRYKMSLVIQNNGDALNGPLYLAIDGLGAGLSLYNPSGFTNRALPANSPYSTLLLPGTAPGALGAGAVLNLTLEVVNPSNAAMTFTTRLLQGPGTP